MALRNGGPLARVPLVVGARVAPERPVVVASRVRLLEPLVVLISPVVGIRRGLLRPVTPRAVLGRRNVPLPLVAPTFVSSGVITSHVSMETNVSLVTIPLRLPRVGLRRAVQAAPANPIVGEAGARDLQMRILPLTRVPLAGLRSVGMVRARYCGWFLRLSSILSRR